jgi:hypothetical protein
MRLALLFLALPLISCTDDYPSAHGRATSVLPQGDGGRGLWNRPHVNPIGGSESAQSFYKRLPTYHVPPKPVPEQLKALKTPEEINQDESRLNAVRTNAKAQAQQGTVKSKQSQQSDAELAALRDKTRARAAAEAAQ